MLTCHTDAKTHSGITANFVNHKYWLRKTILCEDNMLLIVRQ